MLKPRQSSLSLTLDRVPVAVHLDSFANLAAMHFLWQGHNSDFLQLALKTLQQPAALTLQLKSYRYTAPTLGLTRCKRTPGQSGTGDREFVCHIEPDSLSLNIPSYKLTVTLDMAEQHMQRRIAKMTFKKN